MCVYTTHTYTSVLFSFAIYKRPEITWAALEKFMALKINVEFSFVGCARVSDGDAATEEI